MVKTPSLVLNSREESCLVERRSWDCVKESKGQSVMQDNSMVRRVSLANSGPSEIRALMKKMRTEHPELSSLNEEVGSSFHTWHNGIALKGAVRGKSKRQPSSGWPIENQLHALNL